MVRDIERIEQELIALDQRAETIAQVLQSTYNSYLTMLGQAVQRQLINAAYQICTQGYPEQFLALSLTQRQQLQHALQQAANQGQKALLELLTQHTVHQDTDQQKIHPSESSAGSDEATLPASPSSLATSAPSQTTEPDSRDRAAGETITPPRDGSELSGGSEDLANCRPSYNASYSTPPVSPATDPQLDSQSEGGSEEGGASEPLPTLLRSHKKIYQSPLALLLQWHETLEQQITELLRAISRSVNHLLQNFGIVPKYFPEAVLEAAAKSEAFEAVAGPPNLLNLTVEAMEVPAQDSADGSSSSEKPKLFMGGAMPPVKIMAVHMRLSEIEFVDNSVMSWRTRLRETVLQLKALEQDYAKVQRELAIAKAEAAWRSSWIPIAPES